jgi:predicted house-cleaning noncanonical NTP pyrophosphatase (MazG superfamily)
MEIKHHNKLVRDGIPLELSQNGVEFTYSILEGNQLVRALIDKLQEEVIEVRTAENDTERIEELADVLEVCFSLARLISDKYGHEIELAKVRKRQAKGSFDTGVFLLTTKRGVDNG